MIFFSKTHRLDSANLVEELRLVGKLLELLQLVQIGDPVLSDLLDDHICQRGIRQQQPSSGGDTVSLVLELFREELVEVFESAT